MLNGGHMTKTATITKLENALAMAIYNNDKVAEQKFTKALELALNASDFPKVSA